MGNSIFIALLAAVALAVGGSAYYSYEQIHGLDARMAGIESRVAAMQTAMDAQIQAEKAALDKIGKDVADSRIAAENAARGAAQAADASKDAQRAADRTSTTSSRFTSSSLRNK